jgi:hypothetical protein
LLFGAWLTGIPQERAIAWAVKRNLGAVAVVQWGGIAPALQLTRIELYPDHAARRANRPLLLAEDVAVSYDLFPPDGRRIRSIQVRRASVYIDVRDPAAPNYAFLMPGDHTRKGQRTADSAYIPIEFEAGDISLAVETAKGRATVAPVALSATAADGQPLSVSYRSGRATAAWYAGDRETIEIKNVTVDGEVKVDGDNVSWSQKLDAPGLAYTIVSAAADLSGEHPVVNVSAREFTLAGNRLAGFLDAVDAPVRFDELDIESGEARIVLTEAPQLGLKAKASVHGPSMLGAAQPLYTDTARLELDAQHSDVLTAKLLLTLAEGQSLQAELTGNAASGHAKLASERWTRSQLLAALPRAFRGSVDGLGFDSFTAHAEADWTENGFVAKADASSQGSGADAAPIFWALDARGPRDSLAGVEGTLEARIGDRRVHATAAYVAQDHYRAHAQIEEVQLAPWVQLFAGDAAADGILGTIEGTIRAEANGKDAPLEIAPEFRLRQLRYAGVELDEITMTGQMRYHVADGRLDIAEIHAEAVDGMTMFRLAEFEYFTGERRGEGDFTAGANLNIIGAAVGLPDLVGAAQARGRAEIDGSDLLIEGFVSSDWVAFGPVGLPLHDRVDGEIELAYNLDRGDGAFTRCEATVGDGTTVRLLNTKFATEPLTVTGDFECDSDMQLAVGMLWLDDVEGTLTERTAFRIGADTFEADWSLRAQAARLVLPDNAGTAEDLFFEGSGTYRDGLTGSGTATAGRLTAAGGSITDAAGLATFVGNTMIIAPATGRLFGGNVTAEVTVGVLEADLPIHLAGSFDAVDLAIFTDEVQPPNTSLTGTALGTVGVRYSARGLENFTFHASAPKGISVNRSLVSDLLQSDRFLAGAGERIAGRAMDKLLGTAPQRPFDTARMHIFLDAGKIQGTAELRSEKTPQYNGLNLTVNLDMDQSALAEAFQLLEESNLANVQF